MALPEEFDAVKNASGAEFAEDSSSPTGTVYERGLFPRGDPSWELCLLETGRGDRAADETLRGISHLQPSVVLMVGVAGGLKDVSAGDIVVATAVYDYEVGKIVDTEDGPGTFLPRPEGGESAYPLIQRARIERRKPDWTRWLETTPPTQPRIRVEPIVTGKKVVASKENDLYAMLKRNYSAAVALDMESAGVLRAAFSSGVDAIAVRGISDSLSDKGQRDAEGGQERAAAHAAAFALQVIATVDSSKYRVRRSGHLDELGTEIIQSGKANPLLAELGLGIDTYWYRGHMGRYPRTAVAGQMVGSAQAAGTAPKIAMHLVLMDPTDARMVDSYAEHRRSQGLDLEMDRKTAGRRVQNDVLATIVRMHLWKALYPKLDLDIRLTNHLSWIRIDLCSRVAIITKDNPREPMIALRPQSTFYKTFKDELELTASQARALDPHVPGMERSDLSEGGIRSLLSNLQIKLDLEADDFEQIARFASDEGPPYGRPKLGRELRG